MRLFQSRQLIHQRCVSECFFPVLRVQLEDLRFLLSVLDNHLLQSSFVVLNHGLQCLQRMVVALQLQHLLLQALDLPFPLVLLVLHRMQILLILLGMAFTNTLLADMVLSQQLKRRLKLLVLLLQTQVPLAQLLRSMLHRVHLLLQNSNLFCAMTHMLHVQPLILVQFRPQTDNLLQLLLHLEIQVQNASFLLALLLAVVLASHSQLFIIKMKLLQLLVFHI